MDREQKKGVPRKWFEDILKCKGEVRRMEKEVGYGRHLRKTVCGYRKFHLEWPMKGSEKSVQVLS